MYLSQLALHYDKIGSRGSSNEETSPSLSFAKTFLSRRIKFVRPYHTIWSGNVRPCLVKGFLAAFMRYVQCSINKRIKSYTANTFTNISIHIFFIYYPPHNSVSTRMYSLPYRILQFERSHQ